MLKQNHRPVVSREVYTRRSIESAWPSGHWVVDELEEGVRAETAPGAESAPPSSVTVIGGTKFNELELDAYIGGTHGMTIISGGNRGAEKFALEAAEGYGLETMQLPPDKERYGKRANEVHVEAILCTDINSPLLLVGDGVRVKQARAWLKRANWGREVIELA